MECIVPERISPLWGLLKIIDVGIIQADNEDLEAKINRKQKRRNPKKKQQACIHNHEALLCLVTQAPFVLLQIWCCSPHEPRTALLCIVDHLQTFTDTAGYNLFLAIVESRVANFMNTLIGVLIYFSPSTTAFIWYSVNFEKLTPGSSTKLPHWQIHLLS